MGMKMSLDNANYKSFKTADFVLATFLFASQVPLLGIESTTDPRRSIFVFQCSTDTNELIKSFESGQEKIEPLRLLNAQRDLKRRLHDFQDRLATDRRERVEREGNQTAVTFQSGLPTR